MLASDMIAFSVKFSSMMRYMDMRNRFEYGNCFFRRWQEEEKKIILMIPIGLYGLRPTLQLAPRDQ